MRNGLKSSLVVLLMASGYSGFAQQGPPRMERFDLAAPWKSDGTATKSAPAAKTTQNSIAKPANDEEKGEKPNSPSRQGIKIHGHWVIDLKNPDGSLVEHRDFENSLVPQTNIQTLTGDQILALLLSGNASGADPAIAFAQLPATGDASVLCNPSTPASFEFGNGPTGGCIALTTSYNVNTFGSFPGFGTWVSGLNTTVNMTPTVSWVLSGNITIPNYVTTFTAVQTIYSLCLPHTIPVSGFASPSGFGAPRGSFGDRQSDQASNQCVLSLGGDGMLFGALTSTTLSPALTNLVGGQVVSVTVTISFS